jgi:hypothetical protein
VLTNVTVANPTQLSYLTVYPAGESPPLASNLNFTAGEVVPNLVAAELGSNGDLGLYNALGTTNVIVDLKGWFT